MKKNEKGMKPKKLTLTRETLRSLDDEQMKEAAGGRPPLTSDSVNICCA